MAYNGSMHMRSLLFVALVGASGVCRASFDLVLVQDQTASVIHRIDPISRSYLGSFSVPAFGYMAASFVQKTAYLFSSGSVLAYDYNTGAERPERSFNISGLSTCASMSPDQNSVYIGTSAGTVVSYNAATGALNGTLISLPGSDISAITPTADGRLVVLTATGAGHYLRLFSGAGTLLSSINVDASPSYAGRQIAYWAGTGGADYTFFKGTNVNAAYGFAPILRGAGAFGSAGTSTYPGYSSVSTLLPGHTGGYFGGLDSTPSNGFRLTRFTGNFTYASSSLYSNIQDPGASAIVLAPEPGTWAALGLGALALMRRRR